MSRLLEIKEFLSANTAEKPLLLDSRSPGEYDHAHIPGAVNLPLLDNEQRALVGTAFRKQGREAAILKGFDLVGPSFASFIRRTRKLTNGHNVFLYCWRGGLRSNIMSWVLSLGGFQVTLLKGGYKSYRKWVLSEIDAPRNYYVLGGRTGTGKTDILKAMMASASVIDLEALACHKGSAFGHLGQEPQPGNEQFENLLAACLALCPAGQPVWLENESTNIGAVKIPDAIYKAIRESCIVEIRLDPAERRRRILLEYGTFPPAQLSDSVQRIRKRLGEERYRQALAWLEEGKLEPWCDAMLAYYDKMYDYGMDTRQTGRTISIDVTGLDSSAAAQRVLAEAGTFVHLLV